MTARFPGYRLAVIVRAAASLAVAATLLGATSASAQILPIPTLPPIPTIIPPPATGPAPQAYQANDATGFRSILPSGTRGLYNLPELAANLTTGATVPHCCDQLPMYENLVYATPGLKTEDIPKYFKDGSFGVAENNVERTYSPRPACLRTSMKNSRSSAPTYPRPNIAPLRVAP